MSFNIYGLFNLFCLNLCVDSPLLSRSMDEKIAERKVLLPSSSRELTIVSWNVNGIRALVNGKHFAALFERFKHADIICLQETKVSTLEEDVDEKMALVDGYDSFWSCSRKRKGWSGVVTYAKKKYAPVYWMY